MTVAVLMTAWGVLEDWSEARALIDQELTDTNYTLRWYSYDGYHNWYVVCGPIDRKGRRPHLYKGRLADCCRVVATRLGVWKEPEHG